MQPRLECGTPAAPTPAPSATWTKGEGKVEPVSLDKDVFGDGSLIMLYAPGHTPGHHSKLPAFPAAAKQQTAASALCDKGKPT